MTPPWPAIQVDNVSCSNEIKSAMSSLITKGTVDKMASRISSPCWSAKKKNSGINKILVENRITSIKRLIVELNKLGMSCNALISLLERACVMILGKSRLSRTIS